MPPRLSLRSVLWANQIPLGIFLMFILGATVFLVPEVQGTAHQLASQAESGHLDADRIDALGDQIALVWLACLLLFLVVSGLSVGIAEWAYRRVAARAAYLASRAERIATGVDTPVEIAFGVDPLSRLEQAVDKVEIAVADRERRLQAEADRGRFQSQLARALDLASTEANALSVARRALDRIGPTEGAELLVADSSYAHLRQAVATADFSVTKGCGVGCPGDCVAVRRGLTQEFLDPDALDACPLLQSGGPGALCVPVNIAGRPNAILHLPVQAPPPTELVARLETTAAQLGGRLGTLRAFVSVQAAATTDPLTGLANRRSLEDRSAELRKTGTPYSVALCDLDHFKKLNDTYGHESGDRALRLFAQVVRESVRESDTVARIGGEEFVVLLAGLDVEAAAEVMERVRTALASALRSGQVPTFTVSVGVADGEPIQALDAAVASADRRLYVAKRAGRDRVVHGDGPHEADVPHAAK